MNAIPLHQTTLSENFIVVDAHHIDKVTRYLTALLETEINRRLPRADLSRWAIDALLDGGMRPDGKKHESQLVLIHDPQKNALEMFAPSQFDSELNGKAFSHPTLGEVLVNAYSATKEVDRGQYLLDTLVLLADHPEVKRIVVVPDEDDAELMELLRQQLRRMDPDKQSVTILTMSPLVGQGGHQYQQLGLSVTDALGVNPNELPVA